MRASYLLAGGTDCYQNLAVEQALLRTVGPDEVVLYLWQNRKTVVIGRNQSAFGECDCDLLRAEGGFLARRPSGGGAVFHDLGNLNFTFVARRGLYDVRRQLSVILAALESFGLRGEFTGRNDLTLDGRKFSGNAFQNWEDSSCHHGTLLIRSDFALMGRYLHPSARKLEAKGVPSVRSRVVNLGDLNPALTVDTLREALLSAFAREYGTASSAAFAPGRLGEGRVARYRSWLSGDEWLFERRIASAEERTERFDWGEATLRLRVRGGRAESARLFSDAMDADFISEANAVLERTGGDPRAAADGLLSLAGDDETRRQMTRDIVSLFES